MDSKVVYSTIFQPMCIKRQAVRKNDVLTLVQMLMSSFKTIEKNCCHPKNPLALSSCENSALVYTETSGKQLKPLFS